MDSMKHYSTYQSQFIEMFGCKTPNVKVGDVSSVVSGKSISKDLEDIPGDIAYVKVADFNLPENNKYIQVSSRYVTSENANSSKLIPAGTIIFAKNGAASMSNKKRLTAIECCIDMNTLAIIPNSQKVDSEFLYAIFDSLDLSFYVRQGAVPSISPHAIEGIEIYLPSFDEQLSFSKICKQADKSKFTSLKSQFIEMFGNYEMNANFGDLFSSARNGANIKQGTISGGIPITRIETISEGEINRNKMGYAGIVDNTYSSYYLQDGDILVSHINSMKHIGKCALYQRINDETIIHGMNLLCLRPYKDIVNPQYVTYLLRSSIMRKLILDITKPAVNQASFTVKDLCKLKVMLPPISKQEEFVAIVDQADKSKYIN